jgi:acyl-CoA synthetase (AMP-forming)/AMP-acid ligase II
MKLGAAVAQIDTLRRLVESGVLAPSLPDRLLKAGIALWRFGPTPAAAVAASAARYPDQVALIDDRGQVTYRELQERTNALAHALSDQGVNEGDNVALLCRNHRGFVEATVACSKLGANVLYLNTGFAGPQIADVVKREQAAGLIYDDEFAPMIGAHAAAHARSRSPRARRLRHDVAAGDRALGLGPAGRPR